MKNKKTKQKNKTITKEVSNWENDGGNNIAPLISAEKTLKKAKERQHSRSIKSR